MEVVDLEQKLRKQAERELDFANSILIEKGTFGDPMIIGYELLHVPADCIIIPISTDDDITIAKMALTITGCQFCSLVSESWTLPPNVLKQELQRTDSLPSISDHKDRIEVILVHVESIEGWIHIRSLRILRDESGRPTRLGEPTHDSIVKTRQAHGTISNLLDPNYRPEESMTEAVQKILPKMLKH